VNSCFFYHILTIISTVLLSYYPPIQNPMPCVTLHLPLLNGTAKETTRGNLGRRHVPIHCMQQQSAVSKQLGSTAPPQPLRHAAHASHQSITARLPLAQLRSRPARTVPPPIYQRRPHPPLSPLCPRTRPSLPPRTPRPALSVTTTTTAGTVTG
jgi:hypothetical protein